MHATCASRCRRQWKGTVSLRTHRWVLYGSALPGRCPPPSGAPPLCLSGLGAVRSRTVGCEHGHTIGIGAAHLQLPSIAFNLTLPGTAQHSSTQLSPTYRSLTASALSNADNPAVTQASNVAEAICGP